MHLVVPFAAPLSDAGLEALARLRTPVLDTLLARWPTVQRDDADEAALATPHERVLARALGWRVADGAALPWAARSARADGIEVADQAWGLLTPVHWRVGTDAIHLADPGTLALDEAASRALLEAVRPLFEDEGFSLHWGAPLRWYVAHPSLAGLATASLARVIGRNVDRWLPAQREARLLRRLQNEVQMLLYTHPLNAEREAAGLLPVNSFWLSGCGVAQAEAAHDMQLDERLTGPALAADWPAWSEAWSALDASLAAPAITRLSLCGERSALSIEPGERTLLERLAQPFKPRRPAHELLATL